MEFPQTGEVLLLSVILNNIKQEGWVPESGEKVRYRGNLPLYGQEHSIHEEDYEFWSLKW